MKTHPTNVTSQRHVFRNALIVATSAIAFSVAFGAGAARAAPGPLAIFGEGNGGPTAQPLPVPDGGITPVPSPDQVTVPQEPHRARNSLTDNLTDFLEDQAKGEILKRIGNMLGELEGEIIGVIESDALGLIGIALQSPDLAPPELDQVVVPANPPPQSPAPAISGNVGPTGQTHPIPGGGITPTPNGQSNGAPTNQCQQAGCAARLARRPETLPEHAATPHSATERPAAPISPRPQNLPSTEARRIAPQVNPHNQQPQNLPSQNLAPNVARVEHPQGPGTDLHGPRPGGVLIDVAPAGQTNDLTDLRSKILNLRSPS